MTDALICAQKRMPASPAAPSDAIDRDALQMAHQYQALTARRYAEMTPAIISKHRRTERTSRAAYHNRRHLIDEILRQSFIHLYIAILKISTLECHSMSATTFDARRSRR